MAQSCAKASERVFNGTTRCDVNAQSPQSRYKEMTFDLPALTANTTTYTLVSPINRAILIISVKVVFRTAPVVDSPGTSTIQLIHVATDGTTATNITDATSVNGKTAYVPFAAAIATTNPVSLASGSLHCEVVTSNHTVSTAQVGGRMTVVYQAVEDTVISD